MQSVLGPAARPGLRTSRQPRADNHGEPPPSFWCTHSRKGPRAAKTGTGARQAHCSPPLPALPLLPGSVARGLSRWLIFHAPQTASLGDATACAVPLKAAGSALLPFSTGAKICKSGDRNLQPNREGEGARPARHRIRSLYGSSRLGPPPRDPPGSRRSPSRTQPGSHRHPRPRPAVRHPQGREPGAGGAACPDSGRSPAPLQRAASPRRAGGGEPGGAVPRGLGTGSPAGEAAGWWRGARGRWESLLS